MRYPKTKHGFVAQTPISRKAIQRIFRPTRGLHSGDVAQDLPAGFTPEARNFVTEQGAITPRSGLSRFGGSFSFGEPVLGAEEVVDVRSGWGAIAASDTSLYAYHSSVDSWSALSYVPASVITVSDPPSGQSTHYWQFAQIYDASEREYLTIGSNGTNWLKFVKAGGSETTYSDFTWPYNIDQTKAAKAIGVIADRVCLYNSVSSAGTQYPTRASWSARGLPKDFTRGNGAGLEDLVEMRGEILAAVRLADVMMLFTDREVWVQQPTLDDYAFRFYRVTDKIGCPFPLTAKATPFGVMFLSRDLDVYLATPQGVVPISKMEDGTSRIASYLADGLTNAFRAWAVYNAMKRRYEVYYAYEDSGQGFPNRALFYAIDDQSWMPQRFEHELTIGCDLKDPGVLTTWDDLARTWDSFDHAWDSVTAGDERRDVLAFGSGGTAYRFLSDQTSDDGTPIDARWRSHGLSNGMGQVHLKEIWMNYSAASASSASIFLTANNGNSFGSGTPISMLSTNNLIQVPVWGTGQAPQLEIRVADGSQPKVQRVTAELVDAGRYRGA